MEEKKHYNAGDIQILEGLEAVRRRPGMYVGGTDIKALHHTKGKLMLDFLQKYS